MGATCEVPLLRQRCGSIATLKKKKCSNNRMQNLAVAECDHEIPSHAPWACERIAAFVIATLVAITKANHFGRPINLNDYSIGNMIIIYRVFVGTTVYMARG